VKVVAQRRRAEDLRIRDQEPMLVGQIREGCTRILAAQNQQSQLGSPWSPCAAAASPVRRNWARRVYLHSMWSTAVSDIDTCAAASGLSPARIDR
jgi:hypothetical protein